ncbi:MAG: hypothetical protein IJI66_01895 [Erysipelotrichaceae bacterium]|nr:hypothetical protein [Erysipelotrichaceae bacterium]
MNIVGRIERGKSANLNRRKDNFLTDDAALSALNAGLFPNGQMFACIPQIEDVIFVGRTTIIEWIDGTKTVVRCHKDDKYDKTTGLCMAIFKKMCGNSSNKVQRIVSGVEK